MLEAVTKLRDGTKKSRAVAELASLEQGARRRTTAAPGTDPVATAAPPKACGARSHSDLSDSRPWRGPTDDVAASWNRADLSRGARPQLARCRSGPTRRCTSRASSRSSRQALEVLAPAARGGIAKRVKLRGVDRRRARRRSRSRRAAGEVGSGRPDPGSPTGTPHGDRAGPPQEAPAKGREAESAPLPTQGEGVRGRGRPPLGSALTVSNSVRLVRHMDGGPSYRSRRKQVMRVMVLIKATEDSEAGVIAERGAADRDDGLQREARGGRA